MGAAAALLLVAVGGGCSSGGDDEATGERPAGAGKAAPRWERVAQFTGTGNQRTPGFEIAADALQWRVTAACTGSGALRVAVPAAGEPLTQVACPGEEFGFSITTGPNVLDVVGAGAWEVVVDQQVETPIADPALPGMTRENRLSAGSFYGIDQDGEGTATLYRLPDGRRALRLAPFSVTTNTDLFVWASGAALPRTSAEALSTPHVALAELKATVGAQNYLVPDDVPADRLRSVVVWCEPVRTAYAAASLRG